MTSTTEITSTTMTDDEIGELIIALIDEQDGVAKWADIRSELPCSNWHAGEVMVALHLTGRIDAGKYEGNTYVALPLTGSVDARAITSVY